MILIFLKLNCKEIVRKAKIYSRKSRLKNIYNGRKSIRSKPQPTSKPGHIPETSVPPYVTQTIPHIRFSSAIKRINIPTIPAPLACPGATSPIFEFLLKRLRVERVWNFKLLLCTNWTVGWKKYHRRFMQPQGPVVMGTLKNTFSIVMHHYCYVNMFYLYFIIVFDQ